MPGSAALDTAIGLVLVYLVLSLLCSAINELFETWLKDRAVYLERGIRELFADSSGAGFTKAIYEHPLLGGLFPGTYDSTAPSNLPSYIPSRNFALALMDAILPAGTATRSGAARALANGDQASADAVASLRSAVLKIENNDYLRRALLTLVDAAGDDIGRVRANIEMWFNSAMDGVSGWYKRRKQRIILVIGLLVAVAMNVSTTAVAEALWTNQTLRESLAAAAQKYIDSEDQTRTSETPSERLARHVAQLESFAIPIGWTWERDDPRSIKQTDPGVWVERLLGWLLTGCAISLGAPFWFDLLNKFTVVRSTIKPSEKSPAE